MAVGGNVGVTERLFVRRPAVGCIVLLVSQQLFMAERNGSQNAAQRGGE